MALIETPEDSYSPDETDARREAALTKLLTTPHKPQEKIGRRPERRTFKSALKPAPEKPE